MTEQLLEPITVKLAEQIPNLKLLILFGSRAKGNARVESDWDFAVIYEENLPENGNNKGWNSLIILSLLANIFELPEDKMDVVDLERCSPWLAHSIARDSKVLFEKEAGEFERFQQRAIKSEAELKAYQQEVRGKVRAALQRWKA